MGKRKLIEYFRILDISDSYLTSQLFAVIKNSQRMNQPIDYRKFICFIAVISKGSRIQKLLLIFSIFGKGIPDRINGMEEGGGGFGGEDDSMDMKANTTVLKPHDDSDDDDDKVYDPRVSREDIKLHISGTILSMVNVSFEDQQIETLKQSLCGSEESLVDDALELMVDEIMEQYALSSRDDGLNFEEWCHWFTSLDGINEMLMTPAQLSQQ